MTSTYDDLGHVQGQDMTIHSMAIELISVRSNENHGLLSGASILLTVNIFAVRARTEQLYPIAILAILYHVSVIFRSLRHFYTGRYCGTSN